MANVEFIPKQREDTKILFEDLPVGQIFIWAGRHDSTKEAKDEGMATGLKISKYSWFSFSDELIRERRLIDKDKDYCFKVKFVNITITEE